MGIETVTSEELERLKRELSGGARVLCLSGLTSPAAKAFALAEIGRSAASPIVLVTDLNKDLENWETDLKFWSPESTALPFPGFEADVYSGVSPHAETLEKRALALWTLAREIPDFLLVTAKALVTRTGTPDQIRTLGAVLERDGEFPE